MASGTAAEVSPRIPRWGDVRCGSKNGNLSVMEEDENGDSSENVTQTKRGKPPRNLSCMRHCSSTAFFIDPVSSNFFPIKFQSTITSKIPFPQFESYLDLIFKMRFRQCNHRYITLYYSLSNSNIN